MEGISLKDFCGGALQEKVDEAAKQVFGNLQDPNTPWKVKRAINISIAFTQNEDRDDMEVDVSVNTKLAPVTPIATRMAIGKDIETGEIIAEEYGKQIKGQLSLRDLETQNIVIDENVVNTATGEITGKVVDLRKINEA